MLRNTCGDPNLHCCSAQRWWTTLHVLPRGDFPCNLRQQSVVVAARTVCRALLTTHTVSNRRHSTNSITNYSRQRTRTRSGSPESDLIINCRKTGWGTPNFELNCAKMSPGQRQTRRWQQWRLVLQCCQTVRPSPDESVLKARKLHQLTSFSRIYIRRMTTLWWMGTSFRWYTFAAQCMLA